VAPGQATVESWAGKTMGEEAPSGTNAAAAESLWRINNNAPDVGGNTAFRVLKQNGGRGGDSF